MDTCSAFDLDALADACRGDEEDVMEPAMALALAASFGSVDGWRAAHGAALRTLAGTDGWVVLALQSDGSLVVVAVREPGQVAAPGAPVLAVRQRREADAAPAATRWATVYSRYRAAVQAASEGLDAGEEAVGSGVLLDVRRAAVYAASGDLIPGAAWRDPAGVAGWARRAARGHAGHGVLRARPRGLAGDGAAPACRRARRPLPARRHRGVGRCRPRRSTSRRQAMKWVTRERPKIDRLACPWLIGRFIDREAEFLYVPAGDVRRVAEATGATPYDIPGVEMSHVGDRCSFDAFLAKHGLDDPALLQLADIVRGADTSRLDLTPQSAGLYAISLGLSRLFADDHEVLRHGLVIYDALYAWCRDGRQETHAWPPAMA